MKKSGILFPAILVALVLVATSGCDSLFNGGYKKTKSGISYKIFNKSNPDTTTVRVGSVVALDMTYGLKDSIIFNSKEVPGEIRFPVVEPQYEGDFYEALQLFCQGDSATFIIKAGPFFTKTVGQPSLPEGFKEEDELHFQIKFNKVQSPDEIALEEQARIEE